ncbi:MAG: FAD-binding protein, partial [Sphingobium sp.]
VGDALLMGSRIGADTECLDANWWAPSMQLPSRAVPNLDVAQPMFFDHRHPFSLCVNRLGRRFVNESCSYDEFGQAMIADQQRTGANIPCWMVFDAKFRARYPCGAILPSFVMPDRSLPAEWWDSYIFKADSIKALAVKMGVDAVTLADTIGTMNLYARNGKDEAFGRGENGFDRYFGKSDVSPNPCMGPVDTPPYYAVRIDLGDLGSKGGLKTDADGRVMPREGTPLSNLYAIGNSAGSPFGDCYPGGGGTLGPATVFAYIAADHIAGSIR